MIDTYVNPPIEHHEELDLGSGGYGLAHEALRSDKYLNRLKAISSAKARPLILDNGADELTEGMSGDEFFDLVWEVEPTLVIAPDVLHDAKATQKNTREFIQRVDSTPDLEGIKIMAVPQGRTKDEWMTLYEEFDASSRISCIGVPYDLKFNIKTGETYTDVDDQIHAENRIQLMKFLKEEKLMNAPLHLLGMNNLRELLIHRAERYPVRVSNDTTAPFAAAAIGRRWSPGESGAKDWPSLSFDDKFDDQQFDDSLWNLRHYFAATGDVEGYEECQRMMMEREEANV